MIPTPLKTILSSQRYPYAIAKVHNGQIVSTHSYASSIEELHHSYQGWKNAIDQYIMVEMREIGDAIPNVCVNTYWVAI